MSLYNMIHGCKPSVFIVLPMLGKHPDEYPRFRDCFVGDDEHPEYKDKIIVYTRTGGGNREGYVAENQDIRKIPGFIGDYDDNFDSTFACWVFDIPPEWTDDFRKIQEGNIKEISSEYRERLYSVFPKLKDKFDEIFSTEKREESNNVHPLA